jgi:hypothetical protein
MNDRKEQDEKAPGRQGIVVAGVPIPSGGDHRSIMIDFKRARIRRGRSTRDQEPAAHGEAEQRQEEGVRAATEVEGELLIDP